MPDWGSAAHRRLPTFALENGVRQNGLSPQGANSFVRTAHTRLLRRARNRRPGFTRSARAGIRRGHTARELFPLIERMRPATRQATVWDAARPTRRIALSP
jgi:hypothetical protein